MRDEALVIILKTTDELDEKGHITMSMKMEQKPEIQAGIPYIATKTAQTIYITLKNDEYFYVYDYMIEKKYDEDEARELFPEVFI